MTSQQPRGGGGVARRGAWGVTSQALNAAGNILAALLVASQSPVEEFGAWSVGYACLLASLPVSRSVGATPMLLEGAGGARAASARGAVSSSFWFGVLVGTAISGVSLFVTQELRWALLAFAVAVPIFLFQDALRYVYIGRRQTARTALMDMCWLVVQLTGFAALLAVDAVTSYTVTAAWAIGALVSCLVAVPTGALSINPKTAWGYFRHHRWAIARLTPDSLLSGLSTNAVPIVLAGVGGLAATGALRAGQTLFGPLNVVVAGLTPVITVEAVRSLRRGGSQWKLVTMWSLAIGVLGAAVGLIAFLLPDQVGSMLLGESWELVPLVLLPLALQAMLRGPYVCAPLVLRARYLLNEALVYRLINTGISIVLPMAGILAGGARGAAWGLMGSALLNSVAALVMLYVVRNRKGWRDEDEGVEGEPPGARSGSEERGSGGLGREE